MPCKEVKMKKSTLVNPLGKRRKGKATISKYLAAKKVVDRKKKRKKSMGKILA